MRVSVSAARCSNRGGCAPTLRDRPRLQAAQISSHFDKKCSVEREHMIKQIHRDVLRELYERLTDQPIQWVITGSCGLALQGVPVTIHDIDLQTDQPGAYAIERYFASAIARPVRFSSAERIQSHFGALALHGLKVEIMGNVQHRRADGTREAPALFLQHKHYVMLDDMQLPVLALRYECEAYAKLGRTEKVNLLQAWLHLPAST